MKLQALGAMLLLVILGEFIETRGAYKSIRPYKYYRSRGGGHKRVTWHPYIRPSRYRQYKKGPPTLRYHPPLRSNTWHAPRYAEDHTGDERPYTIEIELPKGLRGKSWPSDPRNKIYYDRGIVRDYYNDEDYPDEEEDDEEFEERVMQTGKKKLRIQVVRGVKPTLRINIERNYDLKDIATGGNSTLGRNVSRYNSSMSLKELGQMAYGEWIPIQPVPSFPEALRGA